MPLSLILFFALIVTGCAQKTTAKIEQESLPSVLAEDEEPLFIGDEADASAEHEASEDAEGQGEEESTTQDEVSDDAQPEDGEEDEEPSDTPDPNEQEGDAPVSNEPQPQGEPVPWQPVVCCTENLETAQSVCGEELCIFNQVDPAVVFNGQDFTEHVMALNTTRYNFREIMLKVYLPTVSIDGHIYPAVHEVRDFAKDDMDTEIYWMQDRLICNDGLLERELELRVNPLLCDGEVIALDAELRGEFLSTTVATAKVTVREASEGEVLCLPGAASLLQRLEDEEEMAVAIDTIQYFSKIFSEKVILDTVERVRCLLSWDASRLSDRDMLIQDLLVLWLSVLNHAVSPCQTVSGSDLTVAELIVNIERAIYCDNDQWYTEYLGYTAALVR
ncbi:MAG: hypothetical protein A2284_19440 [Deltaproteobacteria bacterium RIFOXYA12_FULL_61_11]|nr:MAG: hypothetical protein A2284_19440 [Deltaproteobacteria bacterium RIFOXYA12_FULL_61_11]